MNTTITSVTVNTNLNTIDITGYNVDQAVILSDLYADVDMSPVNFHFDLETPGHFKYIWAICNSQTRCKGYRSLGAKVEHLVGATLLLSDNFIEKDNVVLPAKRGRK